MDEHRISSDRLSATIRARGAELTSLRHTEAGDVLWQAGPAWPKHAPVLFPIVGALAGDTLRHAGHSYTLPRHGFARNSDFRWERRDERSCELRLVDDDATRAQYPFRFDFSLRYTIDDDTLTQTFSIGNPGDVALPVSTGAHPAFRWPLRDGVAKEAHVLTFETAEPEAIRRLDGTLLSPHPFPTPIEGRVLRLAPSLFDADAIVMDAPRSTSVRYSAPGCASIDVAWRGFEQLGLWSLRDGNFLCIEPWYGYADPAGFDADFALKPGLAHVEPGGSVTFEMTVRVTPAPASAATSGAGSGLTV